MGTLAEVVTHHVADPPGDPWSHLEWGDPEVAVERLDEAEQCSVQRRTLRFRYVSPEHFWREFAEESGPLSPVLSRMDDDAARAALRTAAVDAVEEWFGDNAVRVDYLQVRAVV